MKKLKNLEFEWKILIITGVVFIIFIFFMQSLFISQLSSSLRQSIDPTLGKTLRTQLDKTTIDTQQQLITNIKRYKQWQTLVPIIIKEQKRMIILFSVTLFIILLILSFWIFKRLTKPLKNLAFSLDKIRVGERVEIETTSGGALGTVEMAVFELQNELDTLREKFLLEGMSDAWQDIAQVMAHEIKNPLTPIRLTLDRIEEKVALGKDIMQDEAILFLNRISKQVDTLELLVNQFRSFSKEPEAEMVPLNVAKIIHETAENLESNITTNILGTATVFADKNLLKQIFLNLWKNSLEAKADTIDVTITENGKFIDLKIKDNGIGIKKENLNRIWLPYITDKKTGTGLGLAVVKKLVETMHGKIICSLDIQADIGLTIILKFKSGVEEK